MKKVILHIIVFLCVSSLSMMAQERDSLTSFIDNNPNAVNFNVVYEGTTVNLSADENYLLVNFSVAHPALQMRFLMQKFSFFVDPSGKKKRKYEVIMPNALDVKEELEAAIPQPSEEKKEDARPDIRPLISALNRKGADFRCEDTVSHLGFQFFHIELDSNRDLVNYYILIPKETLMQDKKLSDKWTLGIFSINDLANMPPPDQEGGGGMMPPPIEGEDQQAVQELMQSDIREWVKFSIDDVNNANLKE